LLDPRRFPFPPPLLFPVSAPVTVSRPRLFSRFFCVSRLKKQIFKMRFF
jgi:hypothetical protein